MSNQRSSPSQTEVESKDPIILAVDTSAPKASYAITQGNRVLATLTTDAFIPHSKTFFSNVSILLKLSNLEIKQIDLFAAVTGPGSFTGLRVGISAIKGLAHSLGKPAFGVNSIDLNALAPGIAGSFLVLIDAGREEVYCGLRRVGDDGTIESIGLDQVGGVPTVIENQTSVPESVFIVGSGADKFKEELELFAEQRGIALKTTRYVSLFARGWQLTGQTDFSIAVVLARRAAVLRASGMASEIHAYYVRPSDAEIKQ
jgi:tRNA threonylcarbamoyladenosine biosynthesis protein TsaB